MLTHLERVTPRQCVKWSLRVLFATAPLAVALLFLWGFHMIEALQDRPQLVLMIYLLLLAIAVCAGVVASLAACHMAIGRAFNAGVRAGERGKPDRAPLRAVE